jgi:hypothetical protein
VAWHGMAWHGIGGMLEVSAGEGGAGKGDAGEGGAGEGRCSSMRAVGANDRRPVSGAHRLLALTSWCSSLGVLLTRRAPHSACSSLGVLLARRAPRSACPRCLLNACLRAARFAQLDPRPQLAPQLGCHHVSPPVHHELAPSILDHAPCCSQAITVCMNVSMVGVLLHTARGASWHGGRITQRFTRCIYTVLARRACAGGDGSRA